MDTNIISALIAARGQRNHQQVQEVVDPVKKVFLIVFAILVLCGTTGCATTSAVSAPPSEESAERMLIVLQTERQLQEKFKALDTLNRLSFTEQFGGGKPLTADQRRNVEIAVSTASQIVRSDLAWARVKPDLIRIIQETFDDEELNGILSFYETPAGKALLQKFPSVEERSARLMLDLMDAAGPKIQAGIERELRNAQLDK